VNPLEIYLVATIVIAAPLSPPHHVQIIIERVASYPACIALKERIEDQAEAAARKFILRHPDGTVFQPKEFVQAECVRP
jgi:hypothetical protein